ncbi:MAG: VIT domain-containing protein [Planctomycetales bacterium]|nr:VIT domain-containing protein [Planctomycetales bacterium]
MNIPQSLWNAIGVLLFSLACLIQVGCSGTDTGDAPAASAPAKDSAIADFAEERYLDESEAMVAGNVASNDSRARSLSTVIRGNTESPTARVTFDLMPGEELWVIAKGFTSTPQPPEDRPGCGCLMAKLPDVEKEVPVPLKHTSVTGNIDGYIASVDVTQQFQNPYSSKIEAVYVFPLPENAAVNEFVMTVGERKIRGIIREREQAEKIYNEARSQGHVASLLTEERPNVFTQKVANIEPGKQIDINIRYFNTLRYDDGAYEFVFPMVVGPRYNPPATTDGIGSVARGGNGVSGQNTEVQYLASNERSGHDVYMSLNIKAGVNIENVRCVNHSVDIKESSESERQITLSPSDSIPNKDFVLRYKVAGEQIKTAMMTHKDDHGQYFTMMLYPPAELKQVQRSPMEMVFVLDCSGSMNGRPLDQARAAVTHALQKLTPRDTFQIIDFSNTASQLGPAPINATPENLRNGLAYLASLNGRGGTEMIEGLKAALDFPHDEGRYRVVSFMTDGYIGNDADILHAVAQKTGDSRIFSFGVGQSPNRYLMDRMALLGRGAVAYLSLNDDPVRIMEQFQDSISHPAMTDLSINWGSMNVTDVYPQIVPDLIVGRPVVLTGRFTGELGTVTVNGRTGMQPVSYSVALDARDANKEHKGIGAVWARLKIADLMAQISRTPDQAEQIQQSVLRTALDYSLMSALTAFVAVDSMTKTEGAFGTTVAVPVPVPEGVRYDTAVEN